MGILFIPFYLIPMVIFFYSFIILVPLVIKRQITLKQILSGFLLSLSLYAAILYYLAYDGKANALVPLILIPLCMFVIPAILSVISQNIKSEKNPFYNVFMISIFFSGFLFIAFTEIIKYFRESGIIHFYL